LSQSLGIVYDRLRWEEKALLKEAELMGINVKFIDIKSMKLDSRTSEEVIKEQFGEVVLQRCISHIRGLSITKYLELNDVKVINNYETNESCGNKMNSTIMLEKAKIPTPRSIISFSSEATINSIDMIGYPAVSKPVIGSWGRLVIPLRNKETAKAFTDVRDQNSNPYNQIHYIQEMIDRPPRDIRCIVVGEEIVTCVYRYSPPDEWRTNVAVGGKTEKCLINSELEEIIFKTSKIFGGGILGIDLMESPKGIVVNEINPTVEFRGASKVTEINIPRAIINYAVNEGDKINND
tara:strand:- start:411 stop:1289 length:879 start_codon:yes stop_codon:yes gene_type:complete